MDPNTHADPANEMSEEEKRILYQKLREEIDPEQFEREFLATTEWVPAEEVEAKLRKNLQEIRARFGRS